jgi:hypothetical protein
VSASLLLGVIVAQTVQAQSAPDADLERIRKALAESSAISVPATVPREGPVFRLTIHGQKPVEPLWNNWSAVPSNIRPWFRGYHHEFLEQVTTEEFRGATLYPRGIDVVQVVQFLAKHLKAANRDRKNANAKQEVRKALEELLACRADPARPGC